MCLYYQIGTTVGDCYLVPHMKHVGTSLKLNGVPRFERGYCGRDILRTVSMLRRPIPSGVG